MLVAGLSQLTQTFGAGGSAGAGSFGGGGQLSCNGSGQSNYGGYGGPGVGQQHSNWIQDRDVHNLIENVSKGSLNNQ